MKIEVWLVALTGALFVAGCEDPESARMEATSVRVIEGGGECVVSGNRIPCDSVAAYLKQELRLRGDAIISVNPEKVGNPEQRVKDVANLLREAGFGNVAVVGFVTLPEPNKALQQTLEDSRR